MLKSTSVTAAEQLLSSDIFFFPAKNGLLWIYVFELNLHTVSLSCRNFHLWSCVLIVTYNICLQAVHDLKMLSSHKMKVCFLPMWIWWRLNVVREKWKCLELPAGLWILSLCKQSKVYKVVQIQFCYQLKKIARIISSSNSMLLIVDCFMNAVGYFRQ